MTPNFPVDSFQQLSTPFYYYDLNLLRRTLDAVKAASAFEGFHVNYAMKANANPEILKIVRQYDLGIDAVSGGEIQSAVEAGFDPRKIMLAGVGKTDREIEMALDIECINVESIEELEVIEEVASRCNKTARIALRINPNIDAHTHHFITTGLAENKFGIDQRFLDRALSFIRESKHLDFQGLHFHIGSQITTNEPYRILCERINNLQEDLRRKGFECRSINVGGGLGIDYDNPDENPIPDFESYFKTFADNLERPAGTTVHFELGRSIVAQCGSLISRVVFVKNGFDKKFVIIDAGFSELIRPALYGAHHLIQNLTSTSEKTEAYDVVGPICESSDVFSENEVLPETKRGDIVALRSAGAYGEVMASHYNMRSLNPCFCIR